MKVAKDLQDKGVREGEVLGNDVVELVAEGLGRDVERQSLNWDHVVSGGKSKSDGKEKGGKESEGLGKVKIPVVAVMGHVDHGKTTLLEALRGSGGLTEGEIGGITQRIGAFQVKVGEVLMTILDTPGHEAFMSMRSHGASATDLIVLIVAADDGVMPQTMESIKMAKREGVPFVVAINKCDKIGADPDKVKAQLSSVAEVQTEDVGGDVQCVQISAKNKEGVDSLIDALVVQSEVLDLKADVNVAATGFIVESRSNKYSGTNVTVIVEKGTLKVGDHFFFTSINSTKGDTHGTVRSLKSPD